MGSTIPVSTVITAVSAIITGIIGIIKYFQYKSRRDKMMIVRENFNAVIKSLASEVEIERMAGAILLRRFFDSHTEVGIADTPYWKEAVNVTAAILRGQATGNFQKLMADGLAFAPTLESVDLQKTNLQFAYFGSEDDSGNFKKIKNLNKADFYRANLTGASLKNAWAQKAQFYQSCLHNTVFKKADLTEANFFEADLKGAKFDGASLYGASFKSAQNIPPGIESKLDEKGVYKDEEKFKSPENVQLTNFGVPVFVSKPGLLEEWQKESIAFLESRLKEKNISMQFIDRPDYVQFGAFPEVHRTMKNCAGIIIYGFKQGEIYEGIWRSGTSEEKTIKNIFLSTPWNQIEAGMASVLDLPILVLTQRGIGGGIFDASDEPHIYHAFIDEIWSKTTFSNVFDAWCSDVLEQDKIIDLTPIDSKQITQ